MISISVLHGTMPFGKGVSTSIFVTIFILIFGLTSVLSAQSAPRGANGGAVITADTWEALGAGLDAPANAMVTVGDYLYVAGGFLTANGSDAIRFARFKHTTVDTWEPINGPQGEVKAMVAHDGKIYIGGYFDNVDGEPYTKFAIYTIPTEIPGGWSAPTDLPDGDVFAMAVLGDYLYVGGSFNNIGTLAVDGAARFHMNNRTWERIGGVASDYFGSSSVSGSVSAITTDGTHVFFAGSFTVNLDGTDVSGVIQYTPGTNTWQALGSGINESTAPTTLAIHDGKLYAGAGIILSGSSTLNKIGVFNYNAVDRASEEWVSFGDALDNTVTQLKVYNGKLFAIGNFNTIDGNAEKGIAMYDFTTPGWSGFGGGLVSGSFGSGESIGFAGGKLYASGGFDTAGGVPASKIARWTADFGTDQSGGGDLPDVPLSAPTNTLTGVSVDPLFDWAAPEGVTVTSYSLFIDDTNPIDESAPYSKIDNISGATQYQYNSQFGLDLELFGNTTYYWIVKAYDGTDVVAQTTTPFSFTTESINTVIPTLVAPVDAQDVSLTPTFTWSKDDLAVSYVLEYQQGATINESATAIPLALDDLTVDGDNYTYTLPQGSALTAGTQYTWQVSVLGADPFDIKTSGTASFTTVDLSPGAFNWGFDLRELIVNGNIEIFIISWTQSDGATSYELDFKIGEQPFTAFGDPVVVNAPSTSFEVDNKKLVDGFTYTVELTAVNEYGRTSADPLTIDYTPTKPVAVSPVDEAPVDAITSFEWESTENFGIIPGSILVQILYSNDESADPVTTPADGIQFEFTGSTEVTESKTLTELFATQNSVELSNFLSDNMGRTLYWRVSNKSVRLADDDPATQREVVWSDLASFYVLFPEEISLGAPSTDILNIAEGTEFTWTPFEVAQDAVQPQYVIEFSETGEFSSSPIKTDYQTFHESPYVPTGSLESGELRHGTTYSWRVLGFAGDQVMKSEVRTFKTELETPLILLSRVNNLVDVKEEITIFKIKSATSYILEYTSDSFENEESIKSFTLLESDFRAGAITSGAASDNENVIIEWITLNYERNKEGDVWEPSTTYQLRVTVVDGESTPKTSEIETFTTQPLPGLFSLNTPENSSVGVSVSPTFIWDQSTNSTEYEFQLSGTLVFEDESLIASKAIDSGNINEPISYTYDGDPLFYISTYYWRVIAKGPGGERISDTYSFTTIPRPATQLNFTTNPQIIKFGETSGQFTVELRDADGNATTRLEATEVSLEANPSSGITFRNVADDADITSVTIPLGQSSESFKVKSATTGAKTITASFTGLTSAEQNLIVHPFASGSGTEEDPYVITNVNQLQAMKDYLSFYFILGNDIDASSTGQTDGLDFEPIGTIADPFEGSLQGNEKKITGLTIKRESVDFVGMFGVAGGRSNISNVFLEDVQIYGSTVVGGLVGRSNGRITNSNSNGSVTGTGGIVGGLVGQNGGSITNSQSSASVSGTNSTGGLVGSSSGNITNSYSSGSVAGSGMHAGGLIGYNEGNVTESYSSGSIDGKTNAGGLVGQNKGSITISYSSASVKGTDSVGGLSGYNDNTITDSYSIGSVSGVSNVGGLVGINAGPIKNSYSSGSVSELGSESRNLGGLVGSNNSGTISSSYWDTQTSGQTTSAGGTDKTTAEMKIQATFVDWDFEEIWIIDPAKNKGYPYLKDLYVEDSPQLLPITLVGPGSSDTDIPENMTLRPTFSWEALLDIENVTYQLEISKHEDFSELFGEVSETQNTELKVDFTLDGPITLNEKTYYWRVKAIDGDDRQLVGESITRSFKTNTNVEIVTPEINADDVGLDQVFEWYSTIPNLYVTIQKDGTSKILLSLYSSDGRYTLQEIIENRVKILDGANGLQTLQPNATYKWYISQHDESTNFLGSTEIRTFTTSPTFGVPRPVLNTPVETNVFSFSWSGDETASYIFEINDSKTDLEASAPSATRTDLTYAGMAFGNSLELASDKLSAGTKYFWRVSLVVKSGDNTAYVTSEIGEFTPIAAPGVITVKSPANNATNVAVSGIKFEWEPDVNATKYQVLVYESSNLETPVIDKTVDAIGDNAGIQSAQFDDVPTLNYVTDYQWRVVGYNGTKRGELNDLSPFTTEINRSIILVGPTQQAPNQTGEYQFEFAVTTSGFPDGTNAVWEIVSSRDDLSANGPNSESSVSYVHNVESAIPGSIQLPESIFGDGQTYYWRVSTQAENSDGYISSEIGEFKVTRTPAQPVITSPAATNVPITGVIFTWNTDPFADAYQVTLHKKDGEQTFDVTVPAITEQSQSYTLNNQLRLFYNTEYEFTVTAINGDRVGLTRTLTFKTVTNKPASVQRVSIVFNVSSALEGLNDLQKREMQRQLANDFCIAARLELQSCNIVVNITSTKSISGGNQGSYSISSEDDAFIFLLWNQVDAPEEFPITNYAIQYRPTGADYWNTFSREASTDTIAVFTGLKEDATYDVRIAGVNENGVGEYSEPVEVETISMEEVLAFIAEVAAEIIATSIEVEELPTEFALFQNYPNPFNPTTTVRFALPEPSEVQLEVYSILGQRIAVLSTGLKPAGYHSIQLDASRWASGTYIYRLRAGDRVFTKKLLLLK